MSPVRHKNIALVGKAAIREHSGSGVARHAILATNAPNVRFLTARSAYSKPSIKTISDLEPVSLSSINGA